ncbi:hypothetical protein K227x_15060 [Rubripirellula lacrimiformis]|uniref:PcfJ-like protein n=1 Tax=Rubripirellula lacrimiformis TaxID=1930273 RepID=A0A517N7L0_9BACT|nr:PcfJ domain-containing protein [Rubripirellula lacrimiformis]QDT03125.1 hypothetical protein K227x_15060 [Rubripirellula lacrimiformis]
MVKKAKSAGVAAPSEKLQSHLRSLGFTTVSQYLVWCEQHGFGRGLNKPNQMLARERRHRADTVAALRQQQVQQKKRSPKDTLLCLAKGDLPVTQVPNQGYRCFGELLCWHRRRVAETGFRQRDLIDLVEHLCAVRSKIIDPSLHNVSLVDGGIPLVASLVLLAAERKRWIRPLDQWRPRTRNPRRQLRSLLRHLLDRYDEVPRFMDQAWTIGLDASGTIDRTGQAYRHWYRHLGLGHSVRKLELPIALNRTMAVWFKQAPDELSIPQALRWAQMMGISGNGSLAAAVMVSRLSDSFDHEPFWATVMQWLAGQPMLDTNQVGPIVDYLHHRRFVAEIAGRGAGDDCPPCPAEPNLTMKGRTAQSVLRQVDAWHRRLASDNRLQVAAWRPSGFAGFEFSEGTLAGGNLKIWTIRELLSSRSLAIEGRKLKHCVASYANSCARGATSIWTMEVETFSGLTKCLTIEVRPGNRQIVQIRGRFNRRMTEKEQSVIQRWCTTAGLTIGKYV